MQAAERAYSVLRAGIISGDFPPASRITESEVAEAAGVSRTPVREALRRLEVEGLLRVVPNQGAFVNRWDETDVEETFELRALLESHATELCARRASTAQVEQLQSLAREHQEIVRSDGDDRLERIAALNASFHGLIQAGAGSEQLNAAISVLANAALVFQTLRDYESADLERSARHHQEIAEAIAAGDGAWAASVMRSHILAARRTFRTHHEHLMVARSNHETKRSRTADKSPGRTP